MATEEPGENPTKQDDVDAVTMRRPTRATDDAAKTVSILENQLSQVQRLSKAAQELQQMLRDLRDAEHDEPSKTRDEPDSSKKDKADAETMKGLIEMFDEVDIDGSGEICLEELRIVLTQKGYDDSFVEHLFCHLDINKDAVVTRQEFSDAMKFIPKEIFTECHVVPTSTLMRFFDEFDIDKSGTVDLHELSKALRANGLSEEVIKAYFKHLDVDGNFEITREEYARCIGITL